MAARTITPGLRALDPYTPIGHTSWGPIFHAAGGRAGSRGVDIIVGDDEGDDPDFDDDDDDDDDDGPDDDERQRQQNRRDAARGWQKPKAKQRREPDPDDDSDDDDPDDDEDEPDVPTDQRRSRGRRGSAEDTDEWTPPTRDQWDRMSDAVSRNNGELRKRRFLGKPLERLGITDEETLRDKMIEWGRDPDSGERLEGGEYEGSDSDLFEQPDGLDRQDDADRAPKRTKAEIAAERRRHEERGMARAEARYKPGMALFAAEAELRSAGWSGKEIGLAIKLIDPDEIEVEFDDSGWPTVHGIEDQVAKIKEEFPDWFRPRRAPTRDEDAEDGRRERSTRLPARRAGTRQVDGGERRRPADKPMTWLQRADAQMMGKRV